MNIANQKRLAYVGSRDGQAKTAADLIRDSDSWFTPDIYLAAVRSTLGEIGLDPFSSDVANEKVGATHYLTSSDDAFTCPWPEVNSVFMNPPYGRRLINQAASKFLVEYYKGKFERGIVLVNNATETKWFQSLLLASTAACFPNHRIAFTNVDDKQVSGNTRGQVFLLFESDVREQSIILAEFKQQFDQFGLVMGRI